MNQPCILGLRESQPVHDIDVYIEERLLEPQIQLPAYTMFTKKREWHLEAASVRSY